MTVVLILVVVLVAPSSGLVLALVSGRQRRVERALDWKREDAVADKAAEVAALLVVRQDAIAAQAAEAAKLLVESNKGVAETAVLTNGKLDVIHTLVNSNMTAALQSELDAKEAQLVLMKEVVELRKTAGQYPAPEAAGLIASLEGKVVKLKAQLVDRFEQNEKAEQQIADTAVKVDQIEKQ